MDKIVIALILVGILCGQLVQLPVFGVSVPILDVTVGLALVLGLVQLIHERRWDNLWASLIFKAFLAVAGVLLLSMTVNASQYTILEVAFSVMFWVRLVAYGAVGFILWQINKTPFSQIATWIVWLCFGLSVLGFIQLGLFPSIEMFEYLGWDPHSFRLVSTFLDPNLLGIFLSFGAGLGTVLFIKQPKPGLGLAVLIILGAIFFTYSRSGLLALVIILGLITFILKRKLFWVSLVALGLIVATSPRLQDRLLGAFKLDVTTQHRIESWQEGWEILSDHPWLGVGYNTLKFSRADYTTSDVATGHAATGFDSSLLTIAATSGWLGLLVWLIFIGLATLPLAIAKARSSLFPLTFVAVTSGLLISSFFVNAWLYPPILALWFVILGLGWKELYDN